MKLFSASFLFLVFTILILFTSNPLSIFGEKNEITVSSSDNNQLYLDTSKNQLLLNFNLDRKIITPEIITNLQYIIPLILTFNIQVYKEGVLFDQPIARQTVVRKIEYDPWSKNYLLKNQTTDTLLFRTKNIKKLEKKILKINHLAVLGSKKLLKGEKYFFELKLSIKSKNFYFGYSVINNLISVLLYPSIKYTSPTLLNQ